MLGPGPSVVEGPGEETLPDARLALDEEGREPSPVGGVLEQPRRALSKRGHAG